MSFLEPISSYLLQQIQYQLQIRFSYTFNKQISSCYQDNNVMRENIKVNFNYIHPLHSEEPKLLPHSPHFKNKVSVNIIKQTLPPKITAFNHKKNIRLLTSQNNDEETLKKIDFQFQAQTLRKQFNNHDGQFLENDHENNNSETCFRHSFLREKENRMLKDQIKQLGRMLIESQNAQKSIRLELQLCKASNQTAFQGYQKESQQKQALNEQLLQKNYLQQQLSQTQHQLADKSILLDNLSRQLEHQRQKSFDMEKAYHELTFYNQELQQQRNKLQAEIQLKVDHLNHLNSELINCHNYYRGLQAETAQIKGEIRLENEEKLNLLQKNKQLSISIGLYSQKLDQLMKNIEQSATVIHSLREDHSKLLQRLQIILNQEEYLSQNFSQIQKLRHQLNLSLNSNSNHNDKIIQQLDQQFQKLNELNNHLQNTNNTLINNQRIMLDQIGWLKQQISNQQVQFQVNFNNKVKEELLKAQSQFQKDLLFKINKIMQLQEEIKCLKACQSVQNELPKQKQYNNSNNLSSEQLSEHIRALKSQSEDVYREQNANMKYELQMLKQQLQLSRMAHEEEVFMIKQNYQVKLQDNNRQYTEQLSIYMKQIEMLMNQIQKMPNQSHSQQNYICNQKYPINIIQQEGEQDEDGQITEDKIQKDLIKYSEDYPIMHEDYKAYSKTSQQREPQQQSSQQILQDILEIDNKINHYIANFNKSKPNSSNKQ